MAKILEEKTAVDKLLKGIDKVANLVKITLGPKGNNVALDRPFSSPLITNDGVTIAKEIELSDPFENMGAKLIKEVCIKTNEVAGDGTTTAIVLAQGFIHEMQKELSRGTSPISLNEKVKYIVNLLVKKLQEKSIKITTNEEIKNIATLSSGSSEVGSLIAKAKHLVGNDGIVSLIEGKSCTTDLSVENGICLENGFLSPYFCTNLAKQCVEFDKAKLLIYDKKLDNINEILPLLEQCSATGQKLLILCDDASDELLKTLVVNKMRGALQIALVRIPFYGEKRKAFLEDLSLLTNSKYYAESKGDNLNGVFLDSLGNISNLVITKDKTTLLCKDQNQEDIDKQKAFLKSLLNSADAYEKEDIKLRLARLNGAIALLSVGADTEIEMQEKKLRIEDALSSTNSALEQGIIIGGGCSLYKLKPYLESLKQSHKDYLPAIEILQKVISYPLSQIAINCDQNAEMVLSIIDQSTEENFGYDGKTNTYCNLLKAGIIDPTKVTITALKNACSVATTILTTRGGVTEKVISKTENI